MLHAMLTLAENGAANAADDADDSTANVLDSISPMFTDTPLWGWAALAGAIFVGLLLGKVVQAAMRRFAERTKQKGWEARGTTLDNAAAPVSLALLTVGIMIGLRFIALTPVGEAFSFGIIKFLFIFAVGWFVYNLVDVIDLAMGRFAETTDSKLDDQIAPLVRKTLRIVLVIVFALVVADTVFGVDITAWLAGLGIAGLAVSLAAQDSVKNLFGSMTILFDKPFQVGQRIKFDGFDCIVQEIGFRSTKARSLEGHLITIPNMKFIDNSVENIAMRPSIRRIMNVTITYDTPPAKIEQAVQILRDILNDADSVQPFDMQAFPPRVYFDELKASSLNIFAIYWFILEEGRGWWEYMDHATTINMKLIKAYNDAGIEFAFPTQTLFLAGDPARELKVNVEEGTN